MKKLSALSIFLIVFATFLHGQIDTTFEKRRALCTWYKLKSEFYYNESKGKNELERLMFLIKARDYIDSAIVCYLSVIRTTPTIEQWKKIMAPELRFDSLQYGMLKPDLDWMKPDTFHVSYSHSDSLGSWVLDTIPRNQSKPKKVIKKKK